MSVSTPSPASGLRVAFIATGDIALPSFRSLLSQDPKPLALVTQPDRPAGRKLVPTPPLIKLEAIAAGIPVLQPERIEEVEAELEALDADIMIVMAYGQLIKTRVLALPKVAFVNLHASLLPKYRGAACIQAAIANGDRETGISSMHVVRKLDAGDVILRRAIPIADEDTGGTLHDKLADLAVEVMHETLHRFAAGTAGREPQDESLVSYVPKLEREHGRINWMRPADDLERMIRAYDPWPGSFTEFDERGVPRRLKLYPQTVVRHGLNLEPGQITRYEGQVLVGTGDGALVLSDVQKEGAKRMAARDFLLGNAMERFQCH